MVQQRHDRPDIITHTIPRIEVFQVTDDELKRIEEGANQIAQDFTFMLTCSSICISFLIALGTGTFDSTMGLTLRAAVGVSGICAVYTGFRWFRNRKTALSVINNIRSRRVDPETE